MLGEIRVGQYVERGAKSAGRRMAGRLDNQRGLRSNRKSVSDVGSTKATSPVLVVPRWDGDTVG